MKKSKKNKRERGAVAVISMFIMTTLILLTAMVVDYGLFNYKGNKLQSAVDAAATAVAANLDATTQTQVGIAKSYLAKNGFTNEDIVVTVEHKGVLDEATADDDTYITSGYMKVTVDAKEGMIFSEVLDMDSMRLKKTAYAKCNANYDQAVPEALKYTLIAGSQSGTPAKPAMELNGRTGDITNMLTSMMEGFINGVNTSIVQPLKELFGFEGDYTDLVHINTSELATNGDVHSNSNIDIAIQAINASRTKDDAYEVFLRDENGELIPVLDENGNPKKQMQEELVLDENGNPIPVYETDNLGNKIEDENGNFVIKKDKNGNNIYEKKQVEHIVYQKGYEYENAETNGADDYGQVTYTAVDAITFSNTSFNSSTHVYTQNQQYLEQTQITLNILNELDYSLIPSENELKNKFLATAYNYFSAHPSISEERKENVIAQKDNLSFDSATKTVTLKNQSMIVYDISHRAAKAMLTMIESGETTMEDLYTIIGMDYDPVTGNNGAAFYDKIADKTGSISYSILIDESDHNSTPVNVDISGLQINRDYDKTGAGTNLSAVTGNTLKTAAGASFSVVNTFRQNLGEEGFIALPNLKPYFVREVNRSIRNATKTKEELGDDQVKGDRNVKNAVKKLGENLSKLLQGVSFIDDKYKNYTSKTNDNGSVTYTPEQELKENAQAQLFTKFKQSSSSGLTDLTGDEHTKFKGFDIFNENNKLRKPSEFINDFTPTASFDHIAKFAQDKLTKDGSNDEGRYGVGAYNAFYNSVIANNGDDKKKYPTNFAGDCVERKRDELEANLDKIGYDARKNSNEIKDDRFRYKAPIYQYYTNTAYNSSVTGIPNYIENNFMPTVNGREVTMNTDRLYNSDQNAPKWSNGETGTRTCDEINVDNRGSNSTKIDANKNVVSHNQIYIKTKNLNILSGSTLTAQQGINLAGNDDKDEKGRLQVRQGSVIYCFGDIRCSTLLMEANTKIYCTGTLTVDKNAVTDSSAVIISNGLSFSGYDYKNNTDPNNNASYYCFGDFVSNRNTSFNGDGKLYTYGNVTVNGTIYAQNGFKLVSEGVVTAYAISATTADNDASVVRGLKQVIVNENGALTVNSPSNDNTSEIFCGEDTVIPSTCSFYVGGNIYIPRVKDSSFVYKPRELRIDNKGLLILQNKAEFGWILIDAGGTLYVTEQASIVNCTLTNRSKAYFLGGLDTVYSNNPTLDLTNESDLFVGENDSSIFQINGCYKGRGTVYIDNDLKVIGSESLDYIPNRNETFVIESGKTCVSGNTSVNVSDGVYVAENCEFSTGKSFYFGSAVYNLGKFIVYGDMIADENTPWFSDKGDGNMAEGISIANGGKNGVKSAVLYVGGNKTTHIRGYLINSGTVVHNGTFDIDGSRIPEDKTFEIYIDEWWTRCAGSWPAYAPHISISNYEGAQFHCVGDIVTDGAIYNYRNSILSSQKHITYGMALMNGGEFVAVDGITHNKIKTRSDGKDVYFDYIEINGDRANGGFSIVNGYNSKDWGFSDAILYAGKNSKVDVGGAVENYGKLYIDSEINVRGFVKAHSDAGYDSAVINRNNAQMYVGGTIYANSNAVYSGENTVFTCKGNLEFGIGLYNEGRMYVLGLITNNESKTVNKRRYRDDKFSLRNGFDKDNKQFTNAVMYAGKGIILGVSEHGDAGAGTLQNGGTLYCNGDCFVFTNEGNCNKKNAFIAQEWSNTVIAGDYFGGGGTTVMNDSIFMTGDDFFSKRAVKINSDETMECGRDDYRKCYIYVGGNMLVNTIGYDLDGNNNPFRSLDIYSNTNIYVDGLVYANCILNMCQNVTFVIGGNKGYNDVYNTYDGATYNNDYDNNGKVDYVDLIRKGISGSKNTGSWNAVKDYVNRDYKLIVTQAVNNGSKSVAILGLAGYGDSGIGKTNCCSTLIVNGSAFVRDECKLRDMDKTYIYGDFTCTDYVELGKALDGKDETEAKTDLFKENGENDNDYKFANAGYMFVDGNYYSKKYNKIYASTSLRVNGDYVTDGYLTLRHDANIYVAKKLKALSSIDAGSYSKIIVAGSMQSVTSNIKIRDNVTCFVGGNMTALKYIELGKFGDYTRNIIAKANLNSFPDPQAENTSYKVGYLYRDDSTGTHYYYSQLDKQWKQYNYKSEVVDALEGDGADYSKDEGEKDENKTDNGAGNEQNQGQEEGGSQTVVIGDTTTLDTASELASDDSDLAHGSTVYVGKTLTSYTDYIKQFAYTAAYVGNYVFAPKYITLRHNADLWVMPETFNNDTYTKKVYPDADNIWQAIKNAFNKLAESFKPKNGSVYTLGELTLNKNASLMGTWDCVIQGKCTLRQDSLVYMGHDFLLVAPSLNVSWNAIKGKESVCGFDTYGTSTGNTSFPVVVYADNNINIMTTIDMKLTYLVANRGNVKLYDVYSRTENAERNAKALPNAICSYSGNIDYFSMYGKLGALMYCPNGKLKLDGYYLEIWGSGVADTVETNTYYMRLHRFTNWRTLDLRLATSGSIFLISEKEYGDANDNVDDIFMFDKGNNSSTTDEEFVKQGASLFFDVNK